MLWLAHRRPFGVRDHRRMSISALLSRHGYIHREDLLERRWSADAIRRAVHVERLLVLRRKWIVHPDAPLGFRAAAAAGGRVTCLSAAEVHGLWLPAAPAALHVALPPHSGSTCADAAVVHRGVGIAASAPRELVDPIENVLLLTARCLDEIDALALWESAVRKQFVTVQHLRTVKWRTATAQRLAHAAGALSDSGLETLFTRRLGRIGIVVRQQVHLLGHNVDGLVGSRLVLQSDGFAHHVERAQRRADLAHDRALRLAGYTVFRYTYEDIMFDWPRVEAEIRAALAGGLHLTP